MEMDLLVVSAPKGIVYHSSTVCNMISPRTGHTSRETEKARMRSELSIICYGQTPDKTFSSLASNNL